MPDFSYKAINASGMVIKGVRSASSDAELAAQLNQSGLHLLESIKKEVLLLMDFRYGYIIVCVFKNLPMFFCLR